MKKYRESRGAAAAVNNGGSDPEDRKGRKLNGNLSDVNVVILSGDQYQKKERDR